MRSRAPCLRTTSRLLPKYYILNPELHLLIELNLSGRVKVFYLSRYSIYQRVQFGRFRINIFKFISSKESRLHSYLNVYESEICIISLLKRCNSYRQPHYKTELYTYNCFKRLKFMFYPYQSEISFPYQAAINSYC